MAKKRMSASKITNSGNSSRTQKEAYEAEATEIVLESDATQDATQFTDHLILLYGQPKIGKSTFTHHFENVYFLPTEPGLKFLKTRKTSINNWKTFIAFVKKIEKQKKFLKTVDMFAIDTVDNLAKMCQAYICGRENISHPSDQEWGKGWEALKTEFQYWILRLINTDKGVIFVGHETDREITSRSIKITKTMPAMPKSCFDFLNNICDMVIYMGHDMKSKKGGKKKVECRCIKTKPSESLEAGERLGKLPPTIFFDSEKEAFEKIEEYFNK